MACKPQDHSQVARSSTIDKYIETGAKVFSNFLCQFKERIKTTEISLKKGINEFGEKDKKQLHDRNYFKLSISKYHEIIRREH
jgi:hypothetical protein